MKDFRHVWVVEFGDGNPLGQTSTNSLIPELGEQNMEVHMIGVRSCTWSRVTCMIREYESTRVRDK